MKNWFSELMAVDVSSHIEKKNGLSYLSWAWAWGELAKRYPLSYYKVYESPQGEIFFRDPIGAHVKTGVTIVWVEDDGTVCTHEAIEMLPVMDFKNKAVPVENIDCTQLNKTIQRSLTKAIARLGLGLYIYAGEDMPEEPDEIKQQRAELQKKVGEAIRKATANMDSSAKMVYGNEFIVPIIGNMNFNKCDDIDKLKELLEKVTAAPAPAKKKTAA